MKFRERLERARLYIGASDRRFRQAIKGLQMEKYFPGGGAQWESDREQSVYLNLAAFLVQRAIVSKFKLEHKHDRKCPICRYVDVERINKDLVKEGFSFQAYRYRTLARRYPFSVTELLHHARRCIPQMAYHFMALLPNKAEQDAMSSIIEDLQEIISSSKQIRDKAVEKGDFDAANKNIPHALNAIVLKGKAQGEFDPMGAIPDDMQKPIEAGGTSVVIVHPGQLPAKHPKQINAKAVSDGEELD